MAHEILVPLDGSRFAEAVLPHAAALARMTDCSLLLLRCVVPDTAHADAVQALPDTRATEQMPIEQETPERYLHAVASRLEATGVERRYEVAMTEDVAQGIVDRSSHDPSVALVAMATHARDSLGHWLDESIANTVLLAAARPLLLVRSQLDTTLQRLPTYSTIMVPLDGSMFAEQALTEAQSLAAVTGATLVLVSVIPPADNTPHGRATMDLAEDAWRMEQYLQQRIQHLQHEGLQARQHMIVGVPAEGILRLAVDERANLIVMSTHGSSGWQRSRMGGVATSVVQHSDLPVLLIRSWEHQRHQPLAKG